MVITPDPDQLEVTFPPEYRIAPEWGHSPLPAPTLVTDQRWPEGTRPLLSVCCMTFNHGRFISEAIEGFLAQRTTFPIQVIVHDDASTDGTAKVVRDYEAKHPQLITAVLRSKNVYSQQRYPGAYLDDITMGKYIALCEGDDSWTDPLKLQQQVTFLEAHPAYSICYHDSVLVDTDGAVISTSCLAPDTRRDASAAELQRAFHIQTQTMCFRNCLGQLPPEYHQAFGRDKFLTSLLGQFGAGKLLPGVLPSRYRSHPGGVDRGQTDAWQKRLDYARTQIALLLYYNRVGEDELRNYYAMRTYRVLHGIYGPALGRWAVGHLHRLRHSLVVCLRWIGARRVLNACRRG